MTEVYITSTGAFYPNRPVDNDHIEDILGKINGEPSWAKSVVLQSCGITKRHYAIDPQTQQLNYTNAQMSALAIASALEIGAYHVNELSLLASGTATPDQLNPGHAVMTHGELPNAPSLEAVSFTGFCASAMAALRYCYLNIKAKTHRLAAVTGSELSSAVLQASRFKVQDTTEMANAIAKNPVLSMNKEFLRWIAADGASALLLSNKPRDNATNFRIDWMELISLANQYETCMYHGARKDKRTGKLHGWLHEPHLDKAVAENYFCISQDVNLLKKSVIKAGIVDVLGDIVKKRQLQAKDYDWFIPHLSSFYFKPKVAEGLAAIEFTIPKEKWFTNLDQVGNLGSAALGSMLHEAVSKNLFKKGDKILCGIPESGRFNYFYMQLTVI